MSKKTTIGIFGIGLDTYWDQFDGLKTRLEKYQEIIVDKMKTHENIDIIDGGLVDNPVMAKDVGEMFREKNISALFLYISTYAVSHTVLPVLQAVEVPLIILNLQPVASIDYDSFNSLNDRGLMTGEWLAHCQACCVPEIAHVCNNAHLNYDIITGYLEEKEAWDEIHSYLAAIDVKMKLQDTRIGILGHYYNGMLDVYTDITRAAIVFGTHFELLEIDSLKALRDKVTSLQIKQKMSEFHSSFNVSPECEENELIRAAHTSCALDALISTHNLGALAYYYEGHDGNDHENIVTSVIAGNTLLTGNHVPVAGECEVKNVIAMKILDLFNSGGSFAEFYAMDFNDDVVLWGHDGPAHPAIAQGDVSLVPLPIYHGKPGKGLSIQMSVKNGPITLLAYVQGPNGSSFLLVAEGESVEGPSLQIGNTNSRYKFPIGAKAFVNEWSKQGPAHHSAIGVGHLASSIEKLSSLLKIPCIRVC